MDSLRLGQLVHTSFPVVGFKTVVSREIPTEIKQAFIEQVVYQYWDSYNPPSAGYRAAYLYQLTSEQSLFGWLYNDGLDDFGRSDVPYFVCYYLAGQLQPSQLENIFICLCTGPVRLMDRQNLPVSLENLVIPDLWSYQPACTGVKIPRDMIEQSQIALHQGELINLFVFAVEEKIQDNSIADRNLFYTTRQKTTPSGMQGVVYAHETTHNTIIQNDLPLVMPSAEDYQQILLARTNVKDRHKAAANFSGKSALILGIIASNVFLLTLILIGYYFLKVAPFAGDVPKVPNSIPTRNPLFTPKNITPTKTLTGHSDSVWSVALSKNGQTLVSASADKTINVWNLNTKEIIFTLIGHNDTVRAIALSTDGQTLASGSGDQTIKIWNFQTFELMRTINTNSGAVWSVAISHDGQILVSGNEDGSIKIWNLYTDKLLHTIHGHEGRVFSVAISPDGKTFATGGLDKTIKVWDLHTGKLICAIAQHKDAVRSVIFSRDGKTLASASWDKTIKIWNWRKTELLHTLVGHTSRVVTLSLGSDPQTLVSGSLDNKIKIWDWHTGELLRTLSGHSDWILAIATSPLKQILVSSSKDKTIKIWQPQINNK
ncbi:WD40 repeat domain-containing protein [Nostoc sp. UHCC 0870]|uniref:WD40 repeat domain-containing protein n=1 Tax=Nostoc sp. UHCC 0870 TaxID=2914041 RepID=UPI001EDFDF6F|nr:WD40 repeat domain-containing protein [Nostoc sp. UHCC 0870]UKO95988.1 WD40 repeat domain-containing protein [Nostoc sp. UHCC 0870]